MSWQKMFIIQGVIVSFLLLCVTPGFSQVAKEQTFSLTAVIEKVDERYQFIVVNEARISLSSETAILDEKGTRLKATDLTSRLPVSLEVLRKPEGFTAKKIVVQPSRRP